METMTREKWTDERLDEFGKRMDERFDRVDERFDDLRQEMKGEFAQIDNRFDVAHREMRQEFAQVDRRFEQIDKQLEWLGRGLETVNRAIIFGSISLSTAFVAGFVTLAIKI
jgi:hypothetical protein